MSRPVTGRLGDRERERPDTHLIVIDRPDPDDTDIPNSSRRTLVPRPRDNALASRSRSSAYVGGDSAEAPVSEGNDDARFARLTLEQQEATAAAARLAARIKTRERRVLA